MPVKLKPPEHANLKNISFVLTGACIDSAVVRFYRSTQMSYHLATEFYEPNMWTLYIGLQKINTVLFLVCFFFINQKEWNLPFLTPYFIVPFQIRIFLIVIIMFTRVFFILSKLCSYMFCLWKFITLFCFLMNYFLYPNNVVKFYKFASAS